jgi:putative transcriptional regulator
MASENTILAIRKYGHIELRLKQYMDERGISRNALARSVNARFEVIDKWYSGKVEKLDLDVLARICYVLDCSVSDILVYTRDD